MGLEHDLKATVDDAIERFSRTGNTLYFCDIYEFKLMLEDGADYRKLNQIVLNLDERFAHQAIYKGLTFVAFTNKEINELYNPGIFKSNI